MAFNSSAACQKATQPRVQRCDFLEPGCLEVSGGFLLVSVGSLSTQAHHAESLSTYGNSHSVAQPRLPVSVAKPQQMPKWNQEGRHPKTKKKQTKTTQKSNTNIKQKPNKNHTNCSSCLEPSPPQSFPPPSRRIAALLSQPGVGELLPDLLTVPGLGASELRPSDAVGLRGWLR